LALKVLDDSIRYEVMTNNGSNEVTREKSEVATSSDSTRAIQIDTKPKVQKRCTRRSNEKNTSKASSRPLEAAS